MSEHPGCTCASVIHKIACCVVLSPARVSLVVSCRPKVTTGGTGEH